MIKYLESGVKTNKKKVENKESKPFGNTSFFLVIGNLQLECRRGVSQETTQFSHESAFSLQWN